MILHFLVIEIGYFSHMRCEKLAHSMYRAISITNIY